MNKYFIDQYRTQEYFHGGISHVDSERLFEMEGFTPILFPHHTNFSWRAKAGRIVYLVKSLNKIKSGSVVFFLFPVYAKMNQLLIRLLFLKKGVRIVCFIADIDGIRDGDDNKLKEEVKIFQRVKYFIVHNKKMQQWVGEKVVNSKSSVFNFWDYLAKPVITTRRLSFDIVFAGNLSKSRFIEKLYLLYNRFPLLKFNLYGPGAADPVSLQVNVKYHGIVHPYDLPESVEGSFGLIWDGESIDGCNGSYGEYLRYNSQHKLSLYILSSIPIIVWKDAATAILVKKYKIGLVINDLYEIEEKIKNISETEYHRMQINMQPLAEKISTGGCIKEAIANILQLIDNSNPGN